MPRTSRAGRRPDPDHVREAKGLPTRSEGNHLALPESDVVPAPPPNLSVDALECWNRTASALFKLGLLSHVSHDKLARYCEAWSDWKNVQELRNKQGANKYKVTKSNWREQNLWKALLVDAERVMQDFEREYGMTPASSTRVRRPKGDNESPMDKLNSFVMNKPPVINVTPTSALNEAS